MQKLILSLSALFLLSMSLILSVHAAPQVTVLENGLSVFLNVNPRAPTVSIQHFVKAGSLHEKPGVTGIAHLFEHMMFRPVRTGERGFFEKLQELGGGANATTRFESTLFTSTVLSKNLMQALYLESDRFMNLKVTDAALKIEREAVTSEYSTKFDNNPLLSLWFSIYQTAYKGHPFGWTIIGERDDLQKIKATDCQQFLSKFYRPNNIGIFVSGSFDSTRALTWIKEYYGAWSKGDRSFLPEDYRHETEMTRVVSPLKSKVKNVLAGFRFPQIGPDNAQVLLVSNFILLESSLSLVKKHLLLDKKLVASIAAFNFWDDSGLSKAAAILLPETQESQFVDELLELPKVFESLSKKEFEAYVRELQIYIREQLLTNESANTFYARSWGKWGELDLIQKILKTTITQAQVLQYIKKYWTRTNLVLALNRED